MDALNLLDGLLFGRTFPHLRYQNLVETLNVPVFCEVTQRRIRHKLTSVAENPLTSIFRTEKGNEAGVKSDTATDSSETLLTFDQTIRNLIPTDKIYK